MQQEEQDIKPKKRKKKGLRRFLWWSLSILLFLLVVQTVLYFYSDQLFGRVLKEVVYQQSKGLYRLNYSKITFNLFSNEFEFDNLQLKVDSNKLNELKEGGNIRNTVELNIEEFNVYGPSLYRLYRYRELEIDACLANKPSITLQVFVENSKSDIGSLKDVMAKNLSVLDAKNIRFNDGLFNVKNKSSNFSLLHISGELGDILVSKENDSSDAIIGYIAVSLGRNEFKTDSATLAFDSVHFNTLDSIVQLEQFSYATSPAKSGNSLKIKLNNIELIGTEFWDAYLKKKLIAKKALLERGQVIIGRKEIIDPDSQYLLLSQVFKEVKINQVQLQNIQLMYESGIKAPEMHFNSTAINGNFWQFGYNPINFKTKAKTLFSEDINTTLQKVQLFGKQSQPEFQFENLTINSENHNIAANGISVVTPKNPYHTIAAKGLSIDGIDIWDLLSNKTYNAALTQITEPTIHLRAQKNDSSDYNLDDLRKNLKKSFNVCQSTDLKFSDGIITAQNKAGSDVLDLKGFNLALYEFDALSDKKGLNEKILAENFNMLVKDGFLRIDDQRLIKTTGLNISSSAKNAFATSVIYRDESADHPDKLDLNGVQISGFDIEKLLLNNEFIAERLFVEHDAKIAWHQRADSVKQSSSLKKLFIEEFQLDSLSAELNGTDSISKAFATKSKLQICDLSYEATDSTNTFTTYGIDWRGREIGNITQKGGHAFFANNWYLSSKDSSIILNDIRIEPLADVDKDVKAQLFAKQGVIAKFHPKKLWNNGDLIAEAFTLERPRIKMTDIREVDELQRKDRLVFPFHNIDGVFESARFKTVSLKDGKMLLRTYRDSAWNELTADHFNAHLFNFSLDSTTTMSAKNLFCADGSTIEAEELVQSSKNGKMTYRVGKGFFYPHQSMAYIEGLDIVNGFASNHEKHFSVLSKEVSLSGFNYFDFWVERKLSIDSVYVVEPKLNTFSRKRENKQAYYEQELPEQLTKNFSQWHINNTLFEQGKVSIGVQDSAGNQTFTKIDGISGAIEQIELEKGIQPQFLYCNNMQLQIDNFKKLLKDDLNAIEFKRALISPKTGTVSIDSFCYVPQVEAIKYAAQFQHQADWIRMLNADITIDTFDFKELLYYDRYLAVNSEISGAELSIFTDKTFDPPPYSVKPMPQDMLRDLPVKLLLPHVSLKNWKVVYEEQHPQGIEPGQIFFDSLSANITNVCNDQLVDSVGFAVVDINAQLMGKSDVHVKMTVPFYDTYDLFEFEGEVGPMDMTDINPILENLAFVTVRNGEAIGMYFVGEADESEAIGDMRFYYTNLNIGLVEGAVDSTQNDKWIRDVKRWFTERIINTVVSSNNSPRNLPITGQIQYNRDHSKSVFHYGAKAIISGILDSIR
ncbi:MAG: hypothetical protein KDC92_10450 [Bacteroidetes bacterium]|nr:hypothetical protein [Bacteroidota bacterium]